jgi:hypothetical protein
LPAPKVKGEIKMALTRGHYRVVKTKYGAKVVTVKSHVKKRPKKK